MRNSSNLNGKVTSGPEDVSAHNRHCPEKLYAGFARTLSGSPGRGDRKLAAARRFVRVWPDLENWYKEPLSVRVGTRWAPLPDGEPARASYFARGYLLFLALKGYARMDYPWLLTVSPLFVPEAAKDLGIELGIDQFIGEAARLGFSNLSMQGVIRWALPRILLHGGHTDSRSIRAEDIEELRIAIREFLEREDLPEIHPLAAQNNDAFRKNWIMRANQLELLLFHRGQVDTQPTKFMRSIKDREPTPPTMQALVDRWLTACRASHRPASLKRFELALYRFMRWLMVQSPEMTDFAHVDRDVILEYMVSLTETPSPRTGQPLGVLARRGHVSALSQFFRDTADWEWEGVPGRPLLSAGDLPRMPMRIPRYIPEEQLAPLMKAVSTLECPYQRTALLLARWTGARKGEIQRLSVDCLDSYPDGTARLRLPAGKTYRERMVPLHEEAAAALRELINLRSRGKERAFVDELTGVPTRYVFMEHGRLLSCSYLFQCSLQVACVQAGLLDGGGRRIISSHRFRHTIGTQLAERGAKLHTIMNILGHRSANMSLVYARISDQEVKRDYLSVLLPGASVAGPGVELLRGGNLTTSDINWLKCNFLKTELELGHCLRLPSEGPCECDLYLTCAKFVTTPAYAPRLRDRRKLELELEADAIDRGWVREQERHRSTIQRIEQLLNDLKETLDDDAPTSS
jgi:integrase